MSVINRDNLSDLGTRAATDYLEKTAFLGAMMGAMATGARAIGGKALGALGMGAGKGVLGNTMGAATTLSYGAEAKGAWNQARANMPPMG